MLETLADIALLMAVAGWVLLGATLWLIDYLSADRRPEDTDLLVRAGVNLDAHRPPLPGASADLPAEPRLLRVWWQALNRPQRFVVERWAEHRHEWSLSPGERDALEWVHERVRMRNAFLLTLGGLLTMGVLLNLASLNAVVVVLWVGLVGYVVVRRWAATRAPEPAPPHAPAASVSGTPTHG